VDVLVEGVRQAAALLLGADREIAAVLWLSLQVSGTATLIALLLGIPAGAGLALTRFPGRTLVVSAVNTGMGLPPVVVGLFVTILLWRSGPFGDWEILYTPAAIVLAQAVIASPIVTGITLAAVQNVPAKFRLQLIALGASRRQMLWVVLREARLPSGNRAFDDKERRHLGTVREYMLGLYLIHAIGLVGLAGLAVSRRTRPIVRDGLAAGSLLTFGVAAFVGVYVAVNPVSFLGGFHRFFFSGDSWRFAETETLRRVFPDSFWIDTAVVLGALVGLQAMLLLGATRYNRRHSSPSRGGP